MSDLFSKLQPNKGYVIAEIACGHEGDPTKLKKLIDCVVESECQIIKFQIFKTFERAIKGHKEWDIFDKLELSKEEWQKQIEYTKNKGLYVFADVYGHDSFSLAKKLNIDGYKIHSEDLLNTQFILEVCKSNKIVIIGVGGAKRREITELLKQINIDAPHSKIILMTGVQTFPTPLEAHSIKEISDLIFKYSKYNVKLGFSDHVDGRKKESFILPLMAFSAGAEVVEKHVTFNRKDKWIDYHSALSSDDFKDFIKQTKSLCDLLNKIGEMNDFEKSYRKMFKKSPAFSNNFDKDHVLQNKDIVYIKDAENSIPVASHNLIGKKINTSVRKNQLIKSNTLSPKIGAIIVARCSSSRLPNKALIKINGRESIVLVIDRIKRCKEVDQIILSTTNEQIDDQLVSIAKREEIDYYRGSTENVALRYSETVDAFNLDHFVRITGDAILCDEKMIDKAIISHLNSSCDVTFMKGMPFGTHKEIVSSNTIKTIMETASKPENTEYLEYYLENDRNFNINYIDSGYVFNSKLRMTLDYKEDLQFFTKIYKHFSKVNPEFTLLEVIEWLNNNENIVSINSHKTQKTPGNLNLNVSLNI
jgi:N,N'-diacetyllegionaminate synthase|tara:strand:+ start:1284 stop:3050 length:1767 start_codon:yes stop_codon:yes gene_type:complete